MRFLDSHQCQIFRAKPAKGRYWIEPKRLIYETAVVLSSVSRSSQFRKSRARHFKASLNSLNKVKQQGQNSWSSTKSVNSDQMGCLFAFTLHDYLDIPCLRVTDIIHDVVKLFIDTVEMIQADVLETTQICTRTCRWSGTTFGDVAMGIVRSSNGARRTQLSFGVEGIQLVCCRSVRVVLTSPWVEISPFCRRKYNIFKYRRLVGSEYKFLLPRST